MNVSHPHLSAQRRLEPGELWRQLQRLLQRLVAVLGNEALLDDCLDILVDFLGADRGLVLLTHADGTPQVVCARGPGRTLSALEREEISRTIITEALHTGRCIVWDPLSERGPSASSTSLGITAGLAAPLQGPGEHTRGVLYVDVRDPRKFVEEQQVEFFMAAAVLLGLILEQRWLSERLRDVVRTAHAHCLEASHTPPLEDLLRAPSLSPVREELRSALAGTQPVLILGESGTGKTLLAQALAEASPRRPIVRAVLGSSDDLNTLRSELFGHEKGAFSGAVSRRGGLVEFAHGGTLILDELLNLPPQAQKLLLDFTQFGTYRPLGYARAEPKRADVRLVAVTNGDISAALRAGQLREDLFYRLSAVTLRLPPLRERREDVPALAEATLRRVDPARPWTLSLELRRLLVAPWLDWPGNVRQLEHLILRARERALSREPACAELRPEHVELRAAEGSAPPPAAPRSSSGTLEEAWQSLQAERQTLEARERELLAQAMERHGGVVARVARELGLARTTLIGRLEALGLNRR